MIFVLFSVLCSVSVAVLLKIARLNGVETKQMIVWNYPVAVFLTYFSLHPDLTAVSCETIPFDLYLPLAILMPMIFVMIALSVRHTGLVKTEVAQRLSLFIPLIASFFLFNETINQKKLLGIGIGLLSILCSIGWHKRSPDSRQSEAMWIYPLSVFVGMGIIDILFKQVALHKIVPYVSAMFIVFFMATLFALLMMIYFIYFEKQRFSMRALGYGILLGGLNFGNILFYMKAHRALPDNPSIVFTGMNIGVISLGALVGVVFFGEKLTRLNYIGVFLAIAAVCIIAYL